MDNQENNFKSGFYIIDRILLQFMFDREPTLLKKINRGYYVLKIYDQLWAIPLRTNSRYTQMRDLDCDSAIPLIDEVILLDGFRFRNRNEEVFYLENDISIQKSFQCFLRKNKLLCKKSVLLVLQKKFYEGVM